MEFHRPSSLLHVLLSLTFFYWPINAQGAVPNILSRVSEGLLVDTSSLILTVSPPTTTTALIPLTTVLAIEPSTSTNTPTLVSTLPTVASSTSSPFPDTTTLITAPSSSIPVSIAPSSSTSTTTLPLLQSAIPTLVLSDSQYKFLGCYNEIATHSAGQAIGTYISPIFSSPNALTVTLCLEGCGAATSPNGTGQYRYVAIEDARDCFCGLTLSNESTLQDQAHCSLPCPSDPTTSCGGNGFFILYELSSLANSTSASTSISSTSAAATSPTSSPTQAPNTKPPAQKYSVRVYVGIPIGIIILVLSLLLLALWYKRRQHTRKPSPEIIPTFNPSEKPLPSASAQTQTSAFARQKSTKEVPADGRRRGGYISLPISTPIPIPLHPSQTLSYESFQSAPLVRDVQHEDVINKNRESFAQFKKRNTKIPSLGTLPSINLMPPSPPPIPVSVLALATNIENKGDRNRVEGKIGKEKVGREKRATFEAWKSGVIPLSPISSRPATPEPESQPPTESETPTLTSSPLNNEIQSPQPLSAVQKQAQRSPWLRYGTNIEDREPEIEIPAIVVEDEEEKMRLVV